ncbi:transmembrane ion channel, partial [Oryctes borbonicus]
MAKIKDFVDCFVLMNTALSLSGGKKLCEMNRPQIHGLDSTIVNISISVQNVYFTDPKKMELEVILFLHQRWVDSRLGANLKTQRMAVTEQIWKPKITFINGKLRNIENREDFIFWRGFTEEGNILLSEKLILSTFCTSNYKYFPFDQQVCQLKFGSYRFPKYEVDLYWAE